MFKVLQFHTVGARCCVRASIDQFEVVHARDEHVFEAALEEVAVAADGGGEGGGGGMKQSYFV